MNGWFTELNSTKTNGGFKNFLIVVTHLNQTNLFSYRAEQYNPATFFISLLLFTFTYVPVITELNDNLRRDDKLTTLLLVTIWCVCQYLNIMSIINKLGPLKVSHFAWRLVSNWILIKNNLTSHMVFEFRILF